MQERAQAEQARFEKPFDPNEYLERQEFELRMKYNPKRRDLCDECGRKREKGLLNWNSDLGRGLPNPFHMAGLKAYSTGFCHVSQCVRKLRRLIDHEVAF